MPPGSPIEFAWVKGAMRPINETWARRAAKQYVEGEVYHMVDQEPRSMASHGHYFARVKELFDNLPEHEAERFPTAEHLRRYALIKTGWHNSQAMTAQSPTAALKLASFIRPLDEFAVVDVRECVVTVFTARTQSFRMGNADFKKSKDDVLGFLEDLIGVTRHATGNAA